MVFHVGLSKTGSSFLQNCVFPEIDVNLIKQFKLHSSIDGKYDITLVSDETLSNDCLWFNCAPRNVVAKRIHDLFPRASIIIVTRDKDDFARSMWREYVEWGGDKSYQAWRNDMKQCNPDVFSFGKYVDLLNYLFERVLVLEFSTLKDDVEYFISEICDFIGVPIPDYENRIVNKSLDKKAAKRWQRFNRFFSSHWSKGRLPMYSNPLYWMRQMRKRLGVQL